jgi:predicted TIM-barrel fold metal-dependent hydrolase
VPRASATSVDAILDCHCHAWRRWPYAPLVPDEDARGTVEQLVYEMDLHGVEQATIVCAAIENNPDNLDYVEFACQRHPGRLHMVADHDCQWSSTYHVPGSAERLRALADRYDLVGFTHYVFEQNDGWLRSEEADAVFAVAADRRLIVNLAAHPAWHADLRELAARHPDVTVLCHTVGGIRADEGLDSPGLADVLASAAVPNIHVKLAGLHYCTDRGWNHPWPDVLAAVERIYEAFGPSRLYWGSDFPASKRFTTYRQSLEAVRAHCAFLSAGDLRLILGENLRRLLDAQR